MKWKIALLLCAFLLPGVYAANAQSLQVSGQVTARSTGLPLAGATVTVKGTSTATATDQEGKFTISVPSKGAVLVVSHTGMTTEEIRIDRAGTLNFNLADMPNSLNEVVIIGYGQQKKSLVTGAISSIKAEQLSTASNIRLDQALQGRTSGVQVLPTSGQPGAGISVRIRGTGSNRFNSPLYIIDGIKAGGIESIDPSEVASLEILKDAASAAIYGSEGANGVIIITTKTGRRNSSEISYQGQFGIQSVKNNFIKMMNAQQYQQYLQEAGVSGRPTAADVANIGEGTNWWNEVLQTAPMQHHSLSFSGGTDKSTYLMSGNIFTQDGVVGGDKARFNRYTARFNSDHKIKSWLNVGNRLMYSHHRRKAISENNEFGSILGSALVMDPTTPAFYPAGGPLPLHVQKAIADGKPLRVDANGNIYGISNYLKGEYGNPLARIDMAKGENVQNKIVGSIFAEVEPFKGFKFTSRFGVDAAFQSGHGWTPTFWFSDESQNTIANGYDYTNTWFNWLLENFGTYQRTFGEHNFTLLAGVSAQKNKEHHVGGSYSGLFKEEDKFSYADFVPDALDRIGSIMITKTLASFYGRLSYDYAGKYLLNATIRRDGSSLFAPGYEWGTFPSVSAGWVISKENFFPSALSRNVNYAKLRGSWGQNGSLSAVGVGEWLNAIGAGLLYPDATGTLVVGAAPASLANPSLRWEASEQLDFGVDLVLFDSKVNLTVDWFKKTTKYLLTGGNAPRFAGNVLRTVNAGDVINKGIEIELGYKNKPTANGLSYDVSVNLTSLNNNVKYLDPNSPILNGDGIGTGWTATAMKVGNPIWYFQGYQTAGIFQNDAEVAAYLQKTGITGYSPKPGEPVVVDVNNDKLITTADMTKIGNPHPSLMYGARVNVAYKGFDLLVFVQGQQGNDVLMGFNRLDRSTANKPYFFYANRWTGEGSTNTWFAANTSNPYIYNSDLMVFDGSYTRIRQLQLGYTFSRSLLNRANIKQARVYVSLDDFFTFTKYPGVDPEGGNNGGASIGIDRGGYPIPRKAMVGISFTF
jgi:TonB-dependent starch-binding outer membrane protein SusC